MALSQTAKEAIYRELKSRHFNNRDGMTSWQVHCFLKRLRIPSSTSEVGNYMRNTYKSKIVKVKGRKRHSWIWHGIDKLEEVVTPKFTTFAQESAKKFD